MTRQTPILLCSLQELQKENTADWKMVANICLAVISAAKNNASISAILSQKVIHVDLFQEQITG